MGIVITDADIAELQTMYPLNNFKAGFTRQEEQFLLYHIKGLGADAAATAAGYNDPSMGDTLLRQDRIRAAIEFLKHKEFNDVRITRERLNTMLLDAHSHAANTLEEVAAIRELGKMNDLYADAKHRGTRMQVNIGSQVNNVKNIKQLERMDEKQLIELAGEEIVLDPEDFQRIEHVRDEGE
jgi:phage terminase small subunit